MRVAVIADIHGNAVALEAILARLAQEGTDRIVCLGDVAAMGPQPREVIGILRSLDCPIVMGNGEAQLLTAKPARPDAPARVYHIIDIYHWCRSLLTEEDRDFLRSFAPTVTIPLGGEATLLCFHGSPHSYYDVIQATTPEDELDQLLSGFRATVMAGGHTHKPFIRRHRDVIFLNPGSAGIPTITSREGEKRLAPWAEYGIVTWDAGRLGVELRRVPVDPRAVRDVALASGMPHAEWWAAGAA